MSTVVVCDVTPAFVVRFATFLIAFLTNKLEAALFRERPARDTDAGWDG